MSRSKIEQPPSAKEQTGNAAAFTHSRIWRERQSAIRDMPVAAVRVCHHGITWKAYILGAGAFTPAGYPLAKAPSDRLGPMSVIHDCTKRMRSLDGGHLKRESAFRRTGNDVFVGEQK